MAKNRRAGDITFDSISQFLERVAKITGMRYTRIEREGTSEMHFAVPVHPQTLPILMAAIPAAIIEEAIAAILPHVDSNKSVPPNDTFEGKKRF